jgi:hypothetical protein
MFPFRWRVSRLEAGSQQFGEFFYRYLSIGRLLHGQDDLVERCITCNEEEPGQ